MQRGTTILIAALIGATLAPALRAEDRQVPYWASIAAGQAMMRSGPDRSYPGIWLYRRRDLPVRVVQVHGAWRRVKDMDGTTGWMLAILLAARRTGVVTGDYQPVRASAGDGARLLWQAQGGVVGRISACDGTWCRIAFGDRKGWIAQRGVWGTDPAERIE